MSLQPKYQRCSIYFTNPANGKEIGRFFEKDGKLEFEGDATETAKAMIDYMKSIWNKKPDLD